MFTLAELADMRDATETLMVDAVTFTANDAEPTFDPNTGQYVEGTGTVLYAGACQVQAGGSPREAVVGEQEVVIDRITIKVPVDAADIPPDSVGEITAVGAISDPSLVGNRYRVIGTHAESITTARHLPCELVTT